MNTYEELSASFPLGALLTGVVYIAAARTLWLRRSTWHVPWEVAATLNVALQAAEIVLISGPVARRISPILHAITGLWNIEDLIGHLAYITAMAAMTYMVVSRLDMSEVQFDRYVHRRIEIPSAIFLPIVFVMFYYAGFGNREFDPVLAHPNLWSRAYFLMYVVADCYLLAHAIPALVIIRRDSRQKNTATAYLCAIGVSIVTCVVMLIGSYPMLVWVMIRAETAAYAIAASYAWRARVKRLRKTPCPG